MKLFKEFFNGFKGGLKSFGQDTSLIVNSVLLAFIYFVGVGITSLFAKLLKKEFLEKKISKERESYWSDLNLKKKSKEEYYRQF